MMLQIYSYNAQILSLSLAFFLLFEWSQDGANEPGSVRDLRDYGGEVKRSVPSLSYHGLTNRHPMLYQRKG